MTYSEFINKIEQLNNLSNEFWNDLVANCDDEKKKKDILKWKHYYNGKYFDDYLFGLYDMGSFIEKSND